MSTYATDKFKYEPIGEKDADKALIYGCSILEAAGIDYWISTGTALGLYRDGAIIKADTDIDVSVMKDDTQAVIQAFHEHVPVLATLSGAVYEQIVYMFEDVLFDIAFCHKYDGRLVNFGAIGYTEEPAKFIDNKETVEFAGYSFPCPQMPQYLAHLYGDWRTPSDTKRNMSCTPEQI